MQGVAAEVPVEVAVGFQQHDGDVLAGQQQGEHGTGGAGTNHAAGRLAHVAHVGHGGLLAAWCRGLGGAVLIGCWW